MSDVSGASIRWVPPGEENPPGLPPIDLPKVNVGPAQPLRERIVITPRRPEPTPPPPAPLAPPAQAPRTAAPAAQGDPWAAAGVTFAPPAQPPKPAPAAAPAKPDTDPWAAAGVTFEAPKTEAKPQVSTSKAFAQGAMSGLTFGLGPAIEGAAEASGMDPSLDASPIPFVPLVRPVVGAFRAAFDAAGAREGYEKGRAKAQTELEAAREQHPYALFAGQLAGGFATPVPGAGLAKGAATFGRRALQAAPSAAAGGALYGAGSAVSEGKSAPEVLKSAAKTGVIAAPVGGVLGGALGRRPPQTGTPGQKAAATAEALGAPLPRGLASDSKFIQSVTAKAKQIPFVGEKIGAGAGRTVKAAGEKIGDISQTLTGGVTGRAAADVLARSGLKGVVNANKNAQNAAYDAVRNSIDTNARFTMPRTDKALNEIMAARKAAGHSNPAQGLEQFRTVAGGATFNGAHRARADARGAGSVTNPNPGYDKGDFNKLTKAMTADLRDMVHAAATVRPPTRGVTTATINGRTVTHGVPPIADQRLAAVHAFEKAEKQFGVLAEQNKLLNKLVNAQGEGAISHILGTASEKSGNLKLLAQLRQSMKPQEFEHVAGTLLAELGQNKATSQFSLNKFVTEWNRLSDGAKNVLFSPAHRKWIEDIADLGRHVKGGDQYVNTSNTAGALILFEAITKAMEIGGLATAAATSGTLAVGAAGGIASGVVALGAPFVLASLLGRPSTAASMSAWTKAYRGVTLNTPTPARMAAFNMATRNLAHTLGVPVEDMARIVASRIGRADEPAQPDKKRDLNQKK